MTDSARGPPVERRGVAASRHGSWAGSEPTATSALAACLHLGVPLELTPPACTFPWVVGALQRVGYWGDSRKGFTAVITELVRWLDGMVCTRGFSLEVSFRSVTFNVVKRIFSIQLMNVNKICKGFSKNIN